MSTRPNAFVAVSISAWHCSAFVTSVGDGAEAIAGRSTSAATAASLRRVAAGDDDLRAFLQEERRGGLPDARPAAGDDRDLVLELAHAESLAEVARLQR